MARRCRQPVLEGGEVHRRHQPRCRQDPAHRVAGTAPGQQRTNAAEADRPQAGEPADAEKPGGHRCRPVPDQQRQTDRGDHQCQDPQRPRRPTRRPHHARVTFDGSPHPEDHDDQGHAASARHPAVPHGAPERRRTMPRPRSPPPRPGRPDGDGDRQAYPHSPRIAYPQPGDQGAGRTCGVWPAAPRPRSAAQARTGASPVLVDRRSPYRSWQRATNVRRHLSLGDPMISNCACRRSRRPARRADLRHRRHTGPAHPVRRRRHAGHRAHRSSAGRCRRPPLRTDRAHLADRGHLWLALTMAPRAPRLAIAGGVLGVLRLARRPVREAVSAPAGARHCRHAGPGPGHGRARPHQQRRHLRARPVVDPRRHRHRPARDRGRQGRRAPLGRSSDRVGALGEGPASRPARRRS